MRNLTRELPEPSDSVMIRHSKLEEIAPLISGRYVYIFAASPGMGKSTFASQMADTFYSDRIHYQITRKDMDPVSLCRGIHQAVKSVFPKYSPVNFEEAEKNESIDPLFFEQYIREIIRSLKKTLKRKTVFILEDTHLLPSIGLSCKTVRLAISMASPNLHFIICSRRECQKAAKDRTGSITFTAGNSFLEFTPNEFRQLANQMMNGYSDFTGFEKIYSMTGGWIHGLRTAFDHIRKKGILPDETAMQEMLSHYFKNMVDENADSGNFKTLMLLSLLDSINISFAIQYQGNTKIAEYLVQFLDNNRFISRLNSMTLKLNSIYAGYLSERCVREVSKLDIDIFLNQAADFELSNGNLLKAVRSLIKARTYSRLEQVVRDNIDWFITADNCGEAYGILSSIPPAVFKNSLWMPLAYGLVIRNLNPENTVGIYETLLEKFEDQHNAAGILLCCSGLIFHHFFVSGNVGAASDCYKKISGILPIYDDSLSPAKKLMVYTSVSLSCIYCADTCDVRTFLEPASALAEEMRSGLFKTVVHFIYSLYYENQSQKKLSGRYLDMLLTGSKQVSKISSRARLANISIFLHFARNGYTKAQEAVSVKIRQKSKSYLDLYPVFKVTLDAMDADNALSSGDTASARKYIDTYSVYDLEKISAYPAAMIYAFKSILAAVEFRQEAEEYAEKSLQLAVSSGLNSYYLSLFHYFKGAATAILGDFRKAENDLHTAIEKAAVADNLNVCAGAHAYLSYLFNSIGDRDSAVEHAAACIKYLRKADRGRFMCAIPEVTQNLFRYAGKDPSVSDYAKNIAFSGYCFAFSRSSELIPLLQVNAFGEMQLTLGDMTLSSESLSVNFKVMIALLLSSKDFSTHQEVIQSYLWPQSSREHARTSFDNLMSRFRKLLTDNFRGINPKNYITVTNGIVKLLNTRCSADEFIKLCTEAWEFYERGEYSACLKNVLTAKDIYEDRYFPFIMDVEKVDARRQYADQAFIDMISLIYRLNDYLPDMVPLDSFFSKWLDIYIHETDMVKTAYKYYKSLNDTVKCFTILKNYSGFLESEGFSRSEIDDLIFAIKSTN